MFIYYWIKSACTVSWHVRRRSVLTVINRNRSANSGHIYGLDGLRAIAIIGVIFYHMYPYTIKGGFLGVSLFFVLSGYLIAITSERSRQRNGFLIGEFYLKRIERIYPPVIITVLSTVGAFYFLYPRSVAGIRSEVVSILLGYNNWWQIAQNSSYFTKIANASPFTHIWSLAVELQFYLIWPVLYFFYIIFSRGRKHRGTNGGIVFFLILSAVSAVLMGVLLPYGSDATRVYYGTDTRIYALLLGVVIGMAGVGTDEFALSNSSAGRKASVPLFFGGMAFVIASFVLTDGMSDFTYTGYMQLVTLVLVLLVVIVADPGLSFGRILENPVLDFIGKRSYEMYLTMYPVIFLFNVRKWTRIPGSALIQWALIIVIAMWEHRAVTLIVKHRRQAAGKTPAGRAVFYLVSAAVLVLMIIGLWATIFSGKKNSDTDELKAELEKNEQMLNERAESHSASSSVSSSSASAPGTSSESSSSSSSATVPADSTATSRDSSGKKSGSDKKKDSSDKDKTDKADGGKKSDTKKKSDSENKKDKDKSDDESESSLSKVVSSVPVTCIGDSVMLGASPALLDALPDNSVVNAHESRQVSAAQDIVDEYKKKGTLGKIVIIALGSNGTFNSSTGQKLIDTIGKDRSIYWINVFGDSIQWEDDSNNAIARIVADNGNVHLIDWNSYASGHDSWFYNDGIHLKPEGQKNYAKMVIEDIQGDLDQLKEEDTNK